MEKPIIRFENVFKQLGSHQVLQGVGLSINKGEVTTIIGKSGGGKSVLLKHIIGLLKPDAGEIFLQGHALSKMKKLETNALLKKFSYVFQEGALFDAMSIFDNIALPLREGTSFSIPEITARVQDKLQLFELKGVSNKYPSQISGGMKRRVALARALVTEPEVVLLDEPTTGLDPIRKNAVYSMIVDLQQKFDLTVVMISHEIPDIFFFSQRIVMLNEGKICFEGTPREIRRSSDAIIQEFIQGLERPRDALTGMATPNQLEQKVKEELARFQSHHIVFSVVMLTIENLGDLNAQIGHVEGQNVLKNFADQIQQRLDITDSCSRYSLDKILVVLHNADMREARQFAARLSNELRAEDLLSKETAKGLVIRISAGYAQAEEDSLLKEVLTQAESKNSLYFEFELAT